MRTGRPPLSDAEKKARGTFDPRWSETERAKRQSATVVALHAGNPAYTEIPDPPEGLGEKAAGEFKDYCRRFHERGILTAEAVEQITYHCLRRERIFRRLAEGKLPSDNDISACEQFSKKVEYLGADVPKPGQDAPRKKFGFVGFAARVEKARKAGS